MPKEAKNQLIEKLLNNIREDFKTHTRDEVNLNMIMHVINVNLRKHLKSELEEKEIMLKPWEYMKDEFWNIITYEDEQKEWKRKHERIEEELKELQKNTDYELTHSRWDDILIQFIRDLWYNGIADEWVKIWKRYA